MSKSIIISERDNIAAVVEGGKVAEFFIHRGDILLGDIFLSKVENVLPSIDAAFVNVGSDKMGFLHASDITGTGPLNQLVKPKQDLIVQVVKEPTGHKGPRVTTQVSIPGRFLVLMPNEKGINVSKKISSAKERARLKSIVSILKPAGVGVIIRTEAEGQTDSEIQEDLELLLESWNNVVTSADTVTAPNLIHRDQDLLYRVIREACTEDINEIVVDTAFAYQRAQQLLQTWNISNNINLSVHKGKESILIAHNIDKEIKTALQTKVNLPCGGYLYIQTTEALTVVDVNSGKFVSSATQNETIRKTNLESVEEIARQLRLRNIGGMIIVDFIDMDNRVDQIAILEHFELALEGDKSNPQIGQISDLGLVELTRHRQGQSLSEIFTKKCKTCNGNGVIVEDFNFVVPPVEAEMAAKSQKIQHYKSGKKGYHAALANNQQKQDRKVGFQGRKVEATPSLNASKAHKARFNKPMNERPEKINKESIKNHMKKEFVPTISSVVKFTAIPSGITRRLGKRFKKDVFTILGEIEEIESQIKVTTDQKKTVAQVKAEASKKPSTITKPQPQKRLAPEPKEEVAPEVKPEGEIVTEEITEEATPAKKTTRRRTTGPRRTTGIRKPRTPRKTTISEE